jgi:hypothetical protein
VPVLSSDIKLEEEKSKDSEVNHINETVSILALGDKIFAQDMSSNGGDTTSIRRLAPEYNAAMEWGTVDGVDHNWMKVPLAKEYQNPVVVAKPVSSRGGDPGVIRIRNVSHNSFELRYNEWAYKDGWHTQERVFYMVVEAGIQSVADLTVEAGRLNSSKLLADGWELIAFSASFSQTPSVFTSVQTCNGGDPVTTRLSNCTATGFDLTMDEEEAKHDGHITETLGWIAIEKGTGNTSDNRSVVVLSDSTNHIPTQINFGQSMARRFPVVVSDMITTYGADPGFLRYQNLGPSSIDIFIQEEASSDAEMNHVVEDVSLFVAGFGGDSGGSCNSLKFTPEGTTFSYDSINRSLELGASEQITLLTTACGNLVTVSSVTKTSGGAWLSADSGGGSKVILNLDAGASGVQAGSTYTGTVKVVAGGITDNLYVTLQ